MAKSRIRIKLKAYDYELLDQSARKIVETVKKTNAKVSGPIPLPSERTVYCVLRSPHIDKDSREHFEKIVHKRLIDIIEVQPQTVESLMKMDLPAGVEVELKL